MPICDKCGTEILQERYEKLHGLCLACYKKLTRGFVPSKQGVKLEPHPTQPIQYKQTSKVKNFIEKNYLGIGSLIFDCIAGIIIAIYLNTNFYAILFAFLAIACGWLGVYSQEKSILALIGLIIGIILFIVSILPPIILLFEILYMAGTV